MLTSVLFGAFHVHLQSMLSQQSLGEVVKATDSADVLALLLVVGLAVFDQSVRGPCGFSTENADESLRVGPLVAHQTLGNIHLFVNMILHDILSSLLLSNNTFFSMSNFLVGKARIF